MAMISTSPLGTGRSSPPTLLFLSADVYPSPLSLSLPPNPYAAPALPVALDSFAVSLFSPDSAASAVPRLNDRGSRHIPTTRNDCLVQIVLRDRSLESTTPETDAYHECNTLRQYWRIRAQIDGISSVGGTPHSLVLINRLQAAPLPASVST